ncbi:MAG: hypothetical protein K0M45_05540 [Candidatus Paracaedibacteraceae bacterium]|nr:hypothetical protein [Candidatus Paracaedibacteraceae bacterium]
MKDNLMKFLSIFGSLMALTVCQAQVQKSSLNFDPGVAWQPKTDPTQSFDADFMVMLATMFPGSEMSKNPQSPGWQQAKDKQDFVKRLYLLMLFNPPVFIAEKQPVNAGNYDVATQSVSYLMRGRRWNIDITGVTAEDIVKSLSGGTPIITYRTAATHGASIKKDGQIVEDKLSGIKSIKALTHGIQHRHLGIDIPLGGYGNPAINNQYLISENGGALNNKALQKIQHGHVYLYAQTFGNGPTPPYVLRYLNPQHSAKNIRSVLLVGIEQSAPGKKSMFGVGHSAASGFKDSTLDPSITNSKKWKHSGIRYQPADYGGMVTYVDAEKIHTWQQACKIFLSWPEAEQKAFMAKWLKLPARQLVHSRNQMMAEIFKSHAAQQSQSGSVHKGPSLQSHNRAGQPPAQRPLAKGKMSSVSSQAH